MLAAAELPKSTDPTPPLSSALTSTNTRLGRVLLLPRGALADHRTCASSRRASTRLWRRPRRRRRCALPAAPSLVGDGARRAFTGPPSPFVGTLDYLMCNGELHATHALLLPSEDTCREDGFLPSARFPSDHLPLLAHFSFSSGADDGAAAPMVTVPEEGSGSVGSPSSLPASAVWAAQIEAAPLEDSSPAKRSRGADGPSVAPAEGAGGERARPRPRRRQQAARRRWRGRGREDNYKLLS